MKTLHITALIVHKFINITNIVLFEYALKINLRNTALVVQKVTKTVQNTIS